MVGSGIASERVINSDDEYSTKELREMIAALAVDMAGIKSENVAQSRKLDRIINYQDNYVTSCSKCKAEINEKITDLTTDMAVSKTKLAIIVGGITTGAGVLSAVIVWALDKIPVLSSVLNQ